MGLFYKANKGHLIDFTLELKGEWYNEIREETRSRFLAPEWYAQSGVEIVWPTEETDWAYMLDEVTEVYIRMTYEIASRERLLIVTSAPEKIGVILKRHMPAKALDNITIAESEINDTWARDTGFLTVLGPNGAELMDFKFNGWGNKFEASKDNAINRNLFGNNYFKGTYTDCNNFVLEGGSIEVDAQGSLLTTESCLLTPTRNTMAEPWAFGRGRHRRAYRHAGSLMPARENRIREMLRQERLPLRKPQPYGKGIAIIPATLG